MGRDKAAIPVFGVDAENALPNLTLAERTARLLQAVTEVSLEVGPGFSALDHVTESPAQTGPLAAMSAGGAELRQRGWEGPVLLVATDLPYLTSGLLEWLADREDGRSVVPVANARPQPLCARYEPADMEVATGLVEDGRRAMFDLLDAVNPIYVPEEAWVLYAGDPRCLNDVDTPEHLDASPRR